MGRHYFSRESLPCLPRRVRADFVPPGTVEFDQATAIASLMIQQGGVYGVAMPCMRLYQGHKEEWRLCVADYYGVAEGDAKTILQKALFGFVEFSEEKGSLPLLQGLGHPLPVKRIKLQGLLQVTEQYHPENLALFSQTETM